MSADTKQIWDAAPSHAAQLGPQDVLPGYKQTDVGMIPEDWAAEPLGNLFVFKNGLNKAKRFFGYGTPIVNYMDVFARPGLRRAHINGRVSLTPQEIKNFEVRRGDVFFTRTSETLDEIGMSSVMLDEPHDTVFSGFVLRARPIDQQLDDVYKQYCFATDAVRQQIVSKGTYTTRALTNGRALSAVRIALPPLTEQRAIAETLSDVDGLLGALEALIAKKRAIKQAAMQQLLTGKTRLPGFSGEWETKQIDELATVDPENLSSATDPGFSFNYISLEQVDQGRLLGFTEEIFRTAPSRARRVLRHDDVLMSTVRPNLMAHLHFKSSKVPRAVCSTGFSVLRPRPDKADAGFLFAHLFGHVVNNRIEKILAGSNYPAISSRDVRMIELPCPPTAAEQAAIATALSDMDAEIAALEARRDKTRAIKQGMMQQLLTGRVRLVQIKDSNGSESSRHTGERAKGCAP